MNELILDGLSALDRIRITGQLSSQVAALSAASTAIQRVKSAAQVSQLIRKLAGETEERYKLTTQKLHQIIQGEVGEKSSLHSPSQRISRTTYDINTTMAGVYGVFSSKYIEQIATALDKAGISFDRKDVERGFVTVPVFQAKAPEEPKRIRNFGWDAVKLSDLSLEDLETLRQQVMAEHANPRNEKGGYLENGQPSLYLYDKKGRWKLDKLAWAVTYKLQEKKDVERENSQVGRVTESQYQAGQAADEYAAKAIGYASFSDYAKAREGTPGAEVKFNVARAKYKIVERLDAGKRADKLELESLALHGANGRGPEALSELRNARIVERNIRAKSGQYSLAPGVSLAAFIAGPRRDPRDVASDPDGHLVVEPGQELKPANPAPEAAKAEEAKQPELQIVEHTTGRGKVIRGVVRTDLSYAEAKAIDEYTFKKDGGYFIREKHLAGAIPEGKSIGAKLKDLAERRDPEDPEAELRRLEEEAQRQADRLADQQLREQKKRAEQVSKLRDTADATIAKAEEEINRDRLANTSRRAGMAASAIAKAEAARAIGRTMKNLADAIESGQATHLAGVTSRASVEALQQRLQSAMIDADSAAKLSYVEQERQKGRAPTENDVKFAKFPMPTWGSAGTSLSRVLDAIKGKRGGPALAEKIRFSPGPDADTVRDLKAIVGDKETGYLIGWWNLEQIARMQTLRRMGISNTMELQAALREYLQFREGAREEDPIKKAERAIIGQKVGIDFFPTPAGESQRMVQLADIQPGERVLEPSAGNGNIADAAKAAGAKVDVIEISSQLRDILTAKGYDVVAHDFESYEPEEKYDAVLMNPPFSDRKDAAHIMRAFDMLKPGGRLVAIAGEGVFFGSDRKAVEFREWLERHAAEVEQLPQGTFMDNKLLARTGANGRMLVMQKS